MNWWTVVKFGVSQVTDVLVAYFKGPKPQETADPTSIGVAMSSGAAASREGKLAEKGKAQ
jgi:hypothetical protein